MAYRTDSLPSLPGDYRQRYHCKHCNDIFPSVRMNQNFCSTPCKQANYHLKKKRLSARTKTYYAYIHRVMDNELDVCVKFGVEGKLGHRVSYQSRASVYDVTRLMSYKFSHKHLALNAERECKRELDCGVLSKSDMPDGYTETTYAHNIDKIVSIYLKHGGVLVSGIPAA